MQIRRLSIKHYQGVKELAWAPDPGVNCLVGPADAGKSTILRALSVLFSPTPSQSISEFDYFQRDLKAGFEIEAVVAGFPPASLGRTPALWGWKDGQMNDLPDEDGFEAVLVVRATGTEDLEVVHQIIPSSGEPLSFPVSLRQRMPFARMNASEYFLREFRLGRGSLLDKSIEGADLRSQIPALFSQQKIELPEKTASRLDALKERFKGAGLPEDLLLGVISPYGYSLTGMVGLLTGESAGVAIPIALAGSGTRQRALFELATVLVGSDPLLVLDEPEAGLEPYRQRALVANVRSLIGKAGQAIMTTHSPATLSALSNEHVWRLMPGMGPVSVRDARFRKLFKAGSDCFLSRLPVLLEGVTEVGVLTVLLNAKSLASKGCEVDTLGLRLIRGQGQPQIFDQADAFVECGMQFGLFVDEEAKHAGKRAGFSKEPLCAFGSWKLIAAVNIEDAVAKYLPLKNVPGLIDLAVSALGGDRESVLRQLNENLKRPGVRDIAQIIQEEDESAVRAALSSCMNKGNWFKEREKGEALGQFLLSVGVPGEIENVIEAFWVRIKAVLAL